MPPRRLAIVMLVATTAMWGASFPLMKAGQRLLDGHAAGAKASSLAMSVGMLTVRFAAALALLAVFQPGLFRRAGRKEWLLGLGVGVFFAAGMVGQMTGLALTPASRSAFLTSMTVVLTPIAVALLHRRLPPGAIWLAAGLAFAGAVAMALPPGGMQVSEPLNIGDFFSLVGAAFFTVQMLLVDHGGKHADGAALTPGMFVGTIGTSAAVWLATREPVHDAMWSSALRTPGFWGVTLALALFCSVIAFVWMNRYQGVVSPSTAAVVYTTEPVFAAGFAMFLPGLLSKWCGLEYANETLTWPMLAGGALILLANYEAVRAASAER